MKEIRFFRLGTDDVAPIAAMETAAWGPLGASERTIRRRFSLGHTMIGAGVDDVVAGAICFAETTDDPHDTAKFPKSFADYSSMPTSAPALSLYVYNLGIRPEFRGTNMARGLLREMIEYGRRVGARWVVGDGRCPSYAGVQDGTPDKVLRDEEFRQTIDSWHRTGKIPSTRAITRDPLLKFYRRLLDCEFLHLAPDFLPEDVASGGYRVIFAKDISQGGAQLI
ncbi:N-acetyltransferase [Mesorhizobium hawassense]|uniref:N-acetyltransferase n=1 Tax=Mesorhizobium hawassense TaxID=1209954 RepID=A0A330HG70_9HYPH|nr:N-acetyltransferase [Mesorhizobium hawassense]RAZ86628.1 N-acetyltransferase [Mesorhizobium hawassense]